MIESALLFAGGMLIGLSIKLVLEMRDRRRAARARALDALRYRPADHCFCCGRRGPCGCL